MLPLTRPILIAVSERRRLVTGRHPSVHEFAAWCGVVAACGVSAIYVREPDLDAGPLAALTRAAVGAAAGWPCQVVVRDRADIAVAAGAHGVHLSAQGMPAAAVRRLLGSACSVGRSVHDEAEARSAVDEGCDYVLLGTIYPSGSKPAGHPALGDVRLGAIAAATPIPVLPIGGVTVARLPALAAVGAAGFAAIGAFAPAEVGLVFDPAALERDVRAVTAAARAALGGATGLGGADAPG